MKLDFETNRIILEDETIYLTAIQNAILKLLYLNKGVPVKHKDIIKAIYNTDMDKYLYECLRQHIYLLNKKLRNCIDIENIRGVGYMIP